MEGVLECGLEEEDGSVGVERSEMVRGSKTAVLKGLPEVERRYWDPAGIANARICHSLVGCGQNYTCFEIYARVTSHSPLLLSPYILSPSSCFLSSLILGPILVALLASTCFTPSIRAPSSLTPSLSLFSSYRSISLSLLAHVTRLPFRICTTTISSHQFTTLLRRISRTVTQRVTRLV